MKMSVNDVAWGLGSVQLYNSSGADVTVRWGLGSVFVLHEYSAPSTGIIPQAMHHYRMLRT